jgi:hypothetical protein
LFDLVAEAGNQEKQQDRGADNKEKTLEDGYCGYDLRIMHKPVHGGIGKINPGTAKQGVNNDDPTCFLKIMDL